jgi:hypothetical protein
MKDPRTIGDIGLAGEIGIDPLLEESFFIVVIKVLHPFVPRNAYL